MTLSIFDTILKFFNSPQTKVTTNTIDQVIDRINQYYAIPQKDVYSVYVPFANVKGNIFDSIGDITGITVDNSKIEVTKSMTISCIVLEENIFVFP